jgi:hypothetical protein
MRRSSFWAFVALLGCEEEVRPDCPDFDDPAECGSHPGCGAFDRLQGSGQECYHLCSPCYPLCPDDTTCPDGLVCVESFVDSGGPETGLASVGLCLPPDATSTNDG